MKIRFIKNHPKGYREGREMDLPEGTAKRLIEGKYAVAVEGGEEPQSETKTAKKPGKTAK